MSRADWKPEAIPEHLRLRVEVRGNDGQAVAAGRDLELLSARLQRHDTPAEQDAWRKAAARWERDDLTSRDCGDLPEQVEVSEVAGIPLLAYPGLLCVGEGVGLRLFRKRADAELASREGIVRLFELATKEQMRQMRRELAGLRRLHPLFASFGGAPSLEQQAYTCLLRYLFGRQPVTPLTRERFEEGCRQGRAKLVGAAEKMIGLVETLLETRRRIVTCPQPYPGMEEDLNRLLPPGFLAAADFGRLPHLCRYLRGVLVRADRARGDAARDRRKAQLVTPYQQALDELWAAADPGNEGRLKKVEEFRWLLEEWRVSVFAQELGTAGKVSAQTARQDARRNQKGIADAKFIPTTPKSAERGVPVTGCYRCQTHSRSSRFPEPPPKRARGLPIPPSSAPGKHERKPSQIDAGGL